MAHQHNHHHHHKTEQHLLWSILINLGITVGEMIGGILTGSLALLSDAFHNFSDMLALVLSYFGTKFEILPPNKRMSYGFRRIEVIVALINVLSLLGITAYIFYEAYQRFLNPRQIDGEVVFVIAFLSLIGNLLAVFILRGDRDQSLNIRSAFLHLLYDAFTSVGVMIAAVIIKVTGWYPIDPLISVLIGGMIIWSSGGLLRETFNIIMEGVPPGIRLEDVADVIKAHPDVSLVHDLHVWALSSNLHALSAHVSISEEALSRFDSICREISQQLAQRFQITHITLQPETTIQSDDSFICDEAHQEGMHN